MDNPKLLSQYKNGNTLVSIFDDGTKIREFNQAPYFNFPESIDLKITDFCDMKCLYCHESSTIKGNHSNLNKLFDILKDLPKGVELAIGGGNPVSHSELIPFLEKIKHKGLISNLTVNQGHLKEYNDLLHYLINEKLIKGLGISITNNNFKYINQLKEISNNIVYHIIAGVNKIEILDTLLKNKNDKVLILGYKQFGFGINYYSIEIQNEIKKWYMYLPKYLDKGVLSFDNLAIEQLNIKRLFTTEGWNMFYMGNDFTHSMYIDGVKEEFAPTSRSKERKSFNDYSLLDYFNIFKNSN